VDVERTENNNPLETLLEEWAVLPPDERALQFQALHDDDAEKLFEIIGVKDQLSLLTELPRTLRRSWIRELPPDDAADLIQEVELDERDEYLALLDPVTRRDVHALLAYSEDEAGGLMSPRYARLRQNMTVDEAITYLRRQANRPIETISYAYVLDANQKLLGVVSFRDLLLKSGEKAIKEFMSTEIISVAENTPQEEVARILNQSNLLAIPVLDANEKLVGIITIDDVVDAIEEEATEDIQKIGGTEALDEPYLDISFWRMIKKRAGWLSILFVGEMFTASAMHLYEDEIAKVVALAVFIPLVISSGGNSGSQASTLVVRAISLNEVRPRHWFRVLYRELLSGLVLGLILGTIGLIRVITLGAGSSQVNIPDLGLTIFFSLIGIVCWGTVMGSMLPIGLKKIGFDPASSSAPLVATLVDVVGLVIYFNIARIFLNL